MASVNFQRFKDPIHSAGMGLAKVLFDRTQNAYSFGLYYQPETWMEIIQWLLKKGYSPFEVEMILRSKIMRWAGTSKRTSLKRFISYNKDYKNFAAVWKSAIDELLMTDVYKSAEKKKQYMEDFGYDDNGNFLKEEAMGGVSAPMATLNNTPGMGNAVPAGVDKVGSGDTWGSTPKKKKKKKKVVKENLNEEYRIVYGNRREINPRLDSTDIIVTNGTIKYRAGTLSLFNGRDRDTKTMEWDLDELSKFLRPEKLSKYKKDSVDSGTRRSDWWDPEEMLQNDIDELNGVRESNINPYDKLGTAMAKKMGIKTPFKKKKDTKNQNSMTMKAEQFRIMPYERFKNLYENKNSKT